MATPAATVASPLLLVSGDDEFAVKQRARQIYGEWCAQAGGFDHEIIDASAANSGEALHALGRLREALQTLPFFGSAKVVWFQNCNFLGEERTASAQAVTANLADLAQELKAFRWENVRLLVSAGKIDKRKVFYKTLEKIGSVEAFAGWSAEDRDWSSEAEHAARQQLRGLKKEIHDEAAAKLVNYVGPNIRLLASETEKLALYAGNRVEIEVEDVDAIVTRNKQSRAFALADALGGRDLVKILTTLDEELWEMKIDSQKSPIGVLYGLIAKVRAMIFMKEMLREGWVKADTEYNRFKTQLTRVPPEAVPQDKRFNPLSMNPYVLFRALGHARNYTLPELIQAMDLLLDCNRRLVSSSLDDGLVLQQALMKMAGKDLAGERP